MFESDQTGLDKSGLDQYDMDQNSLHKMTGSGSMPQSNLPYMNINTSNLQSACNRAVTLCGSSNFSCIRDRNGISIIRSNHICSFLRKWSSHARLSGTFCPEQSWRNTFKCFSFNNIEIADERIQSLQWKSKASFQIDTY